MIRGGILLLATKVGDPQEKAIGFVADSDSAIVKGLIAILHRVYSGEPAEKILNFDIEGLLKKLDLEQHLSMNRRNGLFSMIQRIKALAAMAEGRDTE